MEDKRKRKKERETNQEQKMAFVARMNPTLHPDVAVSKADIEFAGK